MFRIDKREEIEREERRNKRFNWRLPVGSRQLDLAILWKQSENGIHLHIVSRILYIILLWRIRILPEAQKRYFATGAHEYAKEPARLGSNFSLILVSLFTSAESLWFKTPSLPLGISRARAFARASSYSEVSVSLFYTNSLRIFVLWHLYAQVTTNMRYSITWLPCEDAFRK